MGRSRLRRKMNRSEPLALDLEEVSQRLTELKEYLDRLNLVLAAQSTKKYTKQYLEIIGELNGLLDK